MSLESLPNELLLDIFNRVVFSNNLLVKDQIKQWFWIVGICKRLRTLVMNHISSVYSCVAIEHSRNRLKARLIGGGRTILFKTDCLHVVSCHQPIASRKAIAKRIHAETCNHLFRFKTMGQKVPRCSGCKWGVKKNQDILIQYSSIAE